MRVQAGEQSDAVGKDAQDVVLPNLVGIGTPDFVVLNELVAIAADFHHSFEPVLDLGPVHEFAVDFDLLECGGQEH